VSNCSFLSGAGNFLFVLVVALALWADPRAAVAADIDWSLAAGVGTRPDYEGGEDYEAVPIGGVRVTWNENVFLDFSGTHGSGGAPRLRANVVADRFLRFGPLLQYRRPRGDVEEGRVDALPNVDGALELGGFFGFEEQGWQGQVAVAQDVTGSHDGCTVEFSAGYSTEVVEGLRVGLLVASTYASDGYMGTYFTVDTADAPSAGLDAYDADDGIKDVGGTLSLTWRLPGSDHWGIGGVFSYFRMVGDAENSPVVDDAGSPDQLFGGLFVSFDG
jgi:outer membrane protein